MAQRIADVEIQPESDALKALSLSADDFYLALEKALDRLDGKPVTELPRPTNIAIMVHGQERRLGDLARIAVCLNSGQ